MMIINDICCFGRCSLTIGLPLVSAAGIECSIMPTVILSAHTGYEGFTFFDMTGPIMPVFSHLKSMDIKFDAIVTGFMASAGQAELAGKFIESFKREGTLVIVDPSMADDGEMYGDMFDNEFLCAMRKLCALADIITPNVTESFYLLGREYKKNLLCASETEEILRALSNLTTGQAVLTGIETADDKVGCASINKKGEINYCFNEKIPGAVSGTGDIFTSVLAAALLLGFSLEISCETAACYICDTLLHTRKSNTENSLGINFEQTIPQLLRRLGII